MGKYTRTTVINENEVMKDLRHWLDENEQLNLNRDIFARRLTVKKISFIYPDDMPEDEVENKVNEAWNNPELGIAETLTFVVRRHAEDKYMIAYGDWSKGKWSHRLGTKTNRSDLIETAWFVIGCASDDPRTSNLEVTIG